MILKINILKPVNILKAFSPSNPTNDLSAFGIPDTFPS